MIRRQRLAAAVLLLLPGYFAKAQEEAPSSKKTDHYLGIQVNELLRQLISTNSIATIDNPYYIDYTFNNVRSGWGFHSGAGYSNSNTLTGDATISVRTSVTNIAGRLGIERKRMIGKRWMVSYGLDGFYRQSRNMTSTTTNQIGFNGVSITKTMEESLGGSVRANIFFMISQRLLIGTEASYIIRYTDSTRETGTALGGVPTNENSIDTRFAPPLVVWLTVKF